MTPESTFKQQIVQLQGNLKQFALKLTVDRDKANDLVQETTLKALDNEHKYSTDHNFKGWMFTIMRNIFVNDYHSSKRQVMFDNAIDTKIKNITAATTCEDIYGYGEISALIESFPEEYSKPFSLYLRGYKYEEISEMLSIPIGTIKSRIFALRRKLRTILHDYR